MSRNGCDRIAILGIDELGEDEREAAQEAAKARIEQAERRRRGEEERRQEEERQSRKREEAERKAEAQRISEIQAGRKAAKNCVLCGQPIGFLPRLLGMDRHGAWPAPFDSDDAKVEVLAPVPELLREGVDQLERRERPRRMSGYDAARRVLPARAFPRRR